MHLWSTLAAAGVPAGLMLGALGLERLEARLLGGDEAPTPRPTGGRVAEWHAEADQPTAPLPRLPSRPLPR